MAGPGNEASTGDNSPLIDKTAFLHNCSLQVKKGPPYIVGCHDLDCILQALAKGLVVAAVSRLPGDGLPKGVYELWLSLRQDCPIPNPQHPSRRPRSCEHHPSQIEQTKKTKVEEKSEKLEDKAPDDIPTRPCTCYTKFQYFKFPELPETKQGEVPIPTQEKGIKLRYKPVVKTAFSAEVWSDENLRKSCVEAFSNFLKEKKKERKDKVTPSMKEEQQKNLYWCGKFRDSKDDKPYWIEGYYDVVSNPTGPKRIIKQFYFVHKDTMKMKAT